MPDNRPRGRDKNVTGQGKDIYKRGSGQGTGPVGNQSGYAGRPGTGSSGGGPKRSSSGGGKGGILTVIIAAVVLLGGGKLFLGGNSGGSTSADTSADKPFGSFFSGLSGFSAPTQTVNLDNIYGGLSQATSSSGWSLGNNTGKLNTSVASGTRKKYTTIQGNNKDVVTIMVYMCGTDLESESGMGTSDLMEMCGAAIGKNVNLIVYTGGCKKWNNNVVSSSSNQIYKVENGGLVCLNKNAGTAAMTKPATLSDFIKFCAKNYPADRNELIFWDHGGGSISGYGYDEKNKNSGSMSLSGINQALKDGGVKFDFIGFDACLMATAENALMLSNYADYLVASEETEPGIGWYYTNWLTKLSANTSMSTLEIGKLIADDFVDTCARQCRGQKCTLSVVDLAELEKTAPDSLSDFANSTQKLIQNDSYAVVSDARSSAREFAQSSRIDQVDLVHLAGNMDTSEGKELADTLLGAIKYNRTSSNMTNAYGLSIFFPMSKTSYVDSAVATYEAIGLDDDYANCIKAFAGMEVGGQAVSGGSSSALDSLLGSFGSFTQSSTSGQSSLSGDLVSSMLSSLLGGSLSGFDLSGLGFLGRSLDVKSASTYLAENRLDPTALIWQNNGKTNEMYLTEEQWGLVKTVELNVFFDDGEGYLDLGLDNVYEISEYGGLVGEYDGTWLAVNDQPVAYYYLDTFDDGKNYTITGRVPALLNGTRVDLMLVFDNENPNGFIAGAQTDYIGGETSTEAKLVTLQDGDTLDFLCDYYDYDGNYEDSYMLGDRMTVKGTPVISNVYIDADAAAPCYRLTDIYNQTYWTPLIP